MDPFLEAPELWPGFHFSFVEVCRARLNNLLAPRYYVDVVTKPVLEKIQYTPAAQEIPRSPLPADESAGSTTNPLAVAPPVIPEVREIPAFKIHQLTTLEICRIGTNHLVTVVEIFSPGNKNGAGLEEYRLKRWRIMNSELNLVEIDLLRDGTRPAEELQDPPVDAEYVVLVSRAAAAFQPRRAEIWPVPLNKPLPNFPVPLMSADEYQLLDLTAVMQAVYDRGGYDRRIAYHHPLPPPALRLEMQSWWANRGPG